MKKVISDKAIQNREDWVEEIHNLSANFGDNTEILFQQLSKEIKNKGVNRLVEHLRLCGNIPEAYKKDSSEEKLYSKYTDKLLSLAYKTLGIKSNVLTERGDAADVEAFAKDYSFVADAKAFRLSRTAKNQKDFKVQAMDGWKGTKKFAMVVCPIYQLPGKTSQIYKQASERNVCIFTFSHLSLLINYSIKEGKSKTQKLLHNIFKTIEALNPSKNAVDYWWLATNKEILGFSKTISNLWKLEKQAASESTDIAKKEGLKFLAMERERIMKMSHEEALDELIQNRQVDKKIEIIKSVSDTKLFDIN